MNNTACVDSVRLFRVPTVASRERWTTCCMRLRTRAPEHTARFATMAVVTVVRCVSQPDGSSGSACIGMLSHASSHDRRGSAQGRPSLGFFLSEPLPFSPCPRSAGYPISPAAPRSLAPPGVPSAHQRIRACNGGSPTSMRPADSYCEGAVAMCWVTAWISRRARCRGLRRAFADAPAAV